MLGWSFRMIRRSKCMLLGSTIFWCTLILFIVTYLRKEIELSEATQLYIRQYTHACTHFKSRIAKAKGDEKKDVCPCWPKELCE